jgi:hypothetical protein
MGRTRAATSVAKEQAIKNSLTIFPNNTNLNLPVITIRPHANPLNLAGVKTIGEILIKTTDACTPVPCVSKAAYDDKFAT